MHTLISDGGSMTVGRRTANYTWGAFEVTLPEGLEQQEPVDDRLQDGYIYRPDDRGHGRAELTFVRADARIDMNASKSDLEQTLDGASERTKGDAYYTRQISGVGLGKVRLGVDVRQGDMVRVLLWSRYLELPVTAIIPGKSVDGSTPEMAAQVGGQMLRDAELLSKRNSEIDTAIAAEKRERLRQVGAVDQKATQAKDTADQAKQVAQTANSAAAQAQRSADGKSTVFYGATTPAKAKAGDTWFKDLAGGGTVLMQYVNGKWVEKVNTKAIDDKLAANDAALADNDAALTELNDVTLPALKAELEALDTDVARDVASKLATLETKLANADKALKQDLQGELTALETTLKNADTAVTTELTNKLDAARKALEDADKATNTDLSKRLEDARKDLKDASDTIATDLAGVDMLVSNQRPGNLFPDPFFKHSLWGSRYNGDEEFLEITADGVTNGAYYFPNGYDVYQGLMTLEPGASYLLTVDARFSGNEVIKFLHVYGRYRDVDGNRHVPFLGRIDRVNEINYKWGTTSLVFTMPDDVASEATIGFYASSAHDSGSCRLRNVRIARAADSSLIIDGAVTASKVQAGVIDADHIAAGAIVATKLAADSVVAGKIASNAVVADSIAANQIRSGHIASGQITTEKLDADAVTANKLAANAVVARNIKAGEVVAEKLASDSVTARSIEADAVTANAIKAGEVTATKIASDAVSANKLLAEDATIDKLWANGIAAKSITASRLTVSPGNMFPDPHFQDPSWGTGVVHQGSDGISITANGTQQGAYLQPDGQANAAMQHIPGVNYLLTAHLRFGGNANITKFSVYARMERDSGAIGATKVGEFVRFPTDGQEHASYRYRDNSTVLDFSSIKMAAGGYFTLGFFVEASMPNGAVEIRNVRLTPMSGTTLIEDGAITTGKVAADAITANKLAADAVTANAIKAGEITSNHISSSKISSDKITVANGFIKNAMIDNGEITNAKIANLDAGKITAGTINANRIGAKTITGKHLAVDTIEANQIKANVFTQVSNSVLPLIPGTTKPTWIEGLHVLPRSGTKDAALPEGIRSYYRYPGGSMAAGASETATNTYTNTVSVDPNLEYEASWWVRSSNGSPRYIYVTLEDESGDTDIIEKVEGVDDDGNDLSQYTWGNPVRVIITPANSKWTKYKTLFKFKEGTKSVRISDIQFNNRTNSSNSYLYITGLEISPHIIPQREIDQRQDQAIDKIEEYVEQMMDTFYSQSAAYAKKFNELSEPQSGGLVAGQDEPGVMTTTTRTITCTPGWVGHIIVQYTDPDAGGYEKPGLVASRHDVTASNREFTIASSYSIWGTAAIHWFKRPGRAYSTDMSRGAYAMPQGSWETVSTATVGTGDWNLSATVGWDAANNHGAYGIRILVNGSEVARVAPRTGLGPLLPIGSGYRTQSLSASGDGNGRTTKFEIQAYISKGNDSQRRIRKVTGTLDWTKLN